jgi:hydroxymethylpyrimidine/phosphomethylpyrimidine kinase
MEVLCDIGTDAIKIGMLGSAATVQIVAKTCKGSRRRSVAC